MTVTQRSPRAEASRNERGSAAARRRRREWIVDNYEADQVLVQGTRPATGFSRETALREFTRYADSLTRLWAKWGIVDITVTKCCRCYRCGKLLTIENVTVDRIVPGCKGGTYRRTNIRPACFGCNHETGQKLR